MAGISLSTAAAAGAASSDAIPAVTSSTITIGMMDDETGVAASTTGDGVGAAQARIDLQNKEGGVDGRKLKLVAVDTQSVRPRYRRPLRTWSPTTMSSASSPTRPSLSCGQVPHKSGCAGDRRGHRRSPVGHQRQHVHLLSTHFHDLSQRQELQLPHTSNFLKSEGVTKVAVLGYNISPSNTLSLHQVVAADTADGLQNCLEDGQSRSARPTSRP